MPRLGLQGTWILRDPGSTGHKAGVNPGMPVNHRTQKNFICKFDIMVMSCSLSQHCFDWSPASIMRVFLLIRLIVLLEIVLGTVSATWIWFLVWYHTSYTCQDQQAGM